MIQIISTIATDLNKQLPTTVIVISHDKAIQELVVTGDDTVECLLESAVKIEAEMILSKRSFRLTRGAGYRIRTRDGKSMAEFYIRPGKNSNSDAKKITFTVSPGGYRYKEAVTALADTYRQVYAGHPERVTTLLKNIPRAKDMRRLLNHISNHSGTAAVWAG